MKPIWILLTVSTLIGPSTTLPVVQKPKMVTRSYGNFVPTTKNSFHVFDSTEGEGGRVDFQNGVAEGAVDAFAREALVKTSEIQVSSFHTSEHNGVTHVYFQQTLNDIPVVNGVGNLNIDLNGRLHSIGNSFYYGPPPPPLNLVEITSMTTVSDAVESLARLLNIPAGDVSQVTGKELHGGNAKTKQRWLVKGVSFAVGDIEAELGYVQIEMGKGIRLAWTIEVPMKQNHYQACIDVKTKEVLSLLDYISDATYNVFPLGVNDPLQGERKFVVDPEDPEASPSGWHSTGIDDTHTLTIGNNVFAQENFDGDREYFPNHRPDGGQELVFNSSLNLDLWPMEYLDASITQLFYMNNIMHDVFYKYGFNEVAGNFQEDNFDVGGDGSDAIIANVQHGNDWPIPRASFFTSPDGGNGRMDMVMDLRANPPRDQVFDTAIVVHEYLHGISNRLTGGRLNVACLGTGESGGMGEGWGDIFGVIFRTNETTTRDAIFEFGEYAGNGVGLRKFPYSTSMTVNPSTYALVENPEYETVHAKGEVWAVTLYEVYWNLVEKHGFDPDWYNANPAGDEESNIRGGNTIFVQLLIDGMKLQPCYPNFIQARDAIVEADRINNQGDNFLQLWTGFAKRGLGYGAVYPGE